MRGAGERKSAWCISTGSAALKSTGKFRGRGQSSRGGGAEPGELHLLAIELDDRVATQALSRQEE